MEYSSLRPSNFESLTSEEKVENVKRRYKLLRAQIDNTSENVVSDQPSVKSRIDHLRSSTRNDSVQVSSNNQRANELNNLKDRLRPRSKG
jgi:hypothetical protein